MSTREKRYEDMVRETMRSDPPSGGASKARQCADSLRDKARDLIDSARQVIDDTVSSNSEDFLRAARQQGGQ